MLSMVLFSSSPEKVVAQTREREDLAQTDQWKLEDICPSDQAWGQAKDKLASEYGDLAQYQGTLADSAGRLLACLELSSRIDKELSRLYCYASMKSDQDTRVSDYLGLKQQIQKLVTDVSTTASFIDPEIVAMDQATIDTFLAQEPKLKIYEMYLNDLQRTKAHRLSDKEEKILAETGLIAGAPSSIFSVFSNAEKPFPTITLSDGTEALLNQAGYARYRASENRDDRETVFKAFWESYVQFKETFATQLASQVKKDMFYARTRHYESSLHSALDRNNIPVEVYHSLIQNVTDNLPTFHRYLKLKERMLGVDQIKYSDVYAPVVKGLDLDYTYEQGRDLVLDAFKSLGDDYVAVIKQAFDGRWIDVYPTHGKRSGAYSNGGCYDVHPYILLNYNGKYDDVSTLAHELGHTMQSYLSNKKQPYATADYSIFVAEVASTLNEALLINRVLGTVNNDDVRLSLLMNYLDGIKGTVFRQTQFAEFELAIHEAAEAGKPLTGDTLTQMYGEILRKYYGHEQEVCHIDDLYCIEWAYIPHFYYNFYVFQYSTSYTASTALSQNILDGDQEALKRYIAFLSDGGAHYPIDQLKAAGVDMLTADPFKKTIAAMNRTMDQIEAILDSH
ncbi:oligoendopeptidase F [Planctomycetota bacterium]